MKRYIGLDEPEVRCSDGGVFVLAANGDGATVRASEIVSVVSAGENDGTVATAGHRYPFIEIETGDLVLVLQFKDRGTRDAWMVKLGACEFWKQGQQNQRK